MPLTTVELSELTVHLHGPLSIGTGFARGLVNRTVVRGRDGLVFVPGSVLKGKVRSACEALARSRGIAECRAPHPQRMLGDRKTCLICQIFGAPGQGSDIHWQSARLTEEWVEALKPRLSGHATLGQTGTRTQVQLSRKRGLAAEAHLFTSEFAAEGLTFEARPGFNGRLRLTRMSLAEASPVYYELVLLLAGVKMVETLGGSASRGAGACRLDLPKTVIVNRQPLEVAQQLEYVEFLDPDLYREDQEAQT